MKVVHVIWSFTVGGAETMLVDIVNEQIKLNSDITLVIVNKHYNEDLISQIDANIKIIYINRIVGSKNFLPIVKLNLILLYLKPDVIHCHNSNLIKQLFFLRKKACLTVHDVSFDFSNFKFYYKLFAISKSVQKFISETTGMNSTLIYNGIHVDKIKKKTNYSFEVFRIVQISRLEHEKKGQDLLIKALNIIVNQYSIKNVVLDFIGSGSSENYLKELTKLYKLENNVNFSGEKSREFIYSHIKDYELFVQPSIWEGFGLTVVEGLSALVPVLVSNNDGPYEIILNGKYGTAFKCNDYNDLTKMILDIFKNYLIYADIANNNEVLGYIANNFDIKKTALDYIINYKK